MRTRPLHPLAFAPQPAMVEPGGGSAARNVISVRPVWGPTTTSLEGVGEKPGAGVVGTGEGTTVGVPSPQPDATRAAMPRATARPGGRTGWILDPCYTRPSDGGSLGIRPRLAVPLLADDVLVLRRLAVALDGERRHRVVGRRGRQAGEADAELVLLELRRSGRSPAAAPTSPCISRPADRDRLAGPEVDVHVERVALAREARVVGAARLAALGAVDRLAVALHPLAHRASGCVTDSSGIEPSGLRADVEQVVAAVARAGDQVAHDRAWASSSRRRPAW